LQNTSTWSDRLDERLFRTLYATSLVYNTCWEDPAVDRQAVNLTPDDVLLVITSAGCNALDYALLAPKRIHAVDANPRQTALLELKLAAVRGLDFDDFFSVFGDGFHPEFRDLYGRRLRDQLSDFARGYWTGGSIGLPANAAAFIFMACRASWRARSRVTSPCARDSLLMYARCLGASSLDEQRVIYDERVASEMWGRRCAGRCLASSHSACSAYRIPAPRDRGAAFWRRAGYVRESLEYVLRQLPIWSNYFWRLYLHGRYTRSCCPEYLREENFAALKGGLVDRIVPHVHRDRFPARVR